MCRRFDSGPVHCQRCAVPGDSTGFDGGLMAGRGARKRRATKRATKPIRIWDLSTIESRPCGIGGPLGICAHVEAERGFDRFVPHQFHQLGRQRGKWVALPASLCGDQPWPGVRVFRFEGGAPYVVSRLYDTKVL